MNFSFNEEQTLIQSQVAQFIKRDYEWEKRQALVESDLGFSADNWMTFADLGWLGISLSEDVGGFGGSELETMIIMEEFGKGLVLEPFLETVVLCAGLINSLGNKNQKNEILSKVISGKMHLALGFTEPQSRFNLADVTTQAKKEKEGFIISGYKSVVMNAPNANNLIISARTSGKQSEETGISLFIINPKLEGVSLRNYSTVDGRRASELTLENVHIPSRMLLGEEGKGFKELEKAVDSATLAICAEAIGVMEVLYKTTVEYTKTRKQFGQAIGKFQVLQHRMVDMFMEYEQSKSLLYMATIKTAEKADDCKKATSGLKYQVGKAAKFIGQQAVQLHGGMGVTEELNVGHFFKRLTTIITIFGNTDYHLKRYSQL